MFEATILLLSLAGAGPLPAQQNPDLERTARAAARRYELLLRRLAPYHRGGAGGPCDEIIGRFCFHFGDDPPGPSEPEHPDITAARRRAVGAYRVWLSHNPANAEAAGGLIRYLIEDGRAAEAVPVARTHAWAAPGSGSQLLLGLSLHEAGVVEAAEAAFDSARGLAPPDERAALDDVGVLLSPGERKVYEALEGEEREAYHRRLWALSDPSLGTPGNERRSAHYARHGWARILEERPRITGVGMLSWGDDHAEIVLRYGLPRSRERIREPPYRLTWEMRVVSRYDPRAVPFVPEALTVEGIPSQPLPGSPSLLERDTVRSSYAPRSVRRVQGIEGQVTRLPSGDGWVLRVDAQLPPDTASPKAPGAPVGLVAVLDSAGRELSRASVEVTVGPDSVTVIRGETELPVGAYAYQVEVGDDSTGLAGWSRYRLEAPEDGLQLSDPLLALPSDSAVASRRELTPFPGLVLSERAVLVYAEVAGLSRIGGTRTYAVEWWLQRREQGSWVGRALRWLGRTLGLGGDADRPVRLRWESTSSEGEPVPISFALDLTGAAPGLYRLGLTVRDRLSGREATSSRLLRLAPAARPAGAVDPGPG